MQIFDSHVHLEKGLEEYNLKVARKNIIYNSIDLYKSLSPALTDSEKTVSLIFDYKNNLDFVLEEIHANKINAIKIHSRIQKLRVDDYENLITALGKIKKNIPVILDAFYSGSEMDFQPDLSSIIKLVSVFKDRTFIIAHSGGYKLIEYFFHLRSIPNVVYELSFSLQYLYDSSIFTDLKKLIKYTDKKRLLFGSDFPYADPNLQLQTLIDIFKELKIDSSDQEDILYNNSYSLFVNAAI